MRTLIRQDDTMVAVETAPAIVDYINIFNATKVVCDNDFGEAPWDICDGFEHTVKSAHRVADNVSDFNVEQMRGYCYCDHHRENIVIQLSEGEDYGLYKWHRERGATKQVAREIVAAGRRQALDQLVRWYSAGWQWYGVRCDFRTLGEELHDSVWGFDNIDYAENTGVPEIANNVADQLEKAGFTVIGRPERVPYPSRAQKQERIRYNLNTQNWKD